MSGKHHKGAKHRKATTADPAATIALAAAVMAGVVLALVRLIRVR